MPAITIQLPVLEAEQRIEVEARVNGQKKTYSFRVEIFPWEQCEGLHESRAACLRKMLENYDKDWQLLQIGAFTEENISILFKRRN